MNSDKIDTWLNRNFVHLIYLPLLTIAILLLLRAGCNCPQPNVTHEERKERKDTSKLAINHAPVHVEGTAKITPRPRRAVLIQSIKTQSFAPDSDLIAINIANNSVPFDSVDSLEPFTASLDTTVGKDSIHAKYYYPENQFRIEFKRTADTVQVINTTTEVTRYIEPDWYEKPNFTIPATAGVILTILLLAR